MAVTIICSHADECESDDCSYKTSCMMEDDAWRHMETVFTKVPTGVTGECGDLGKYIVLLLQDSDVGQCEPIW